MINVLRDKNARGWGWAFAMAEVKYVENATLCAVEDGHEYFYGVNREWRGASVDKNWKWLNGKDGAGHRLGEPKHLTFILLAPTTSLERALWKCEQITRRLRYDRMEVRFMYARVINNDGDGVKFTHDYVGVRNSDHIKESSCGADKTIAAWGYSPVHRDQAETVKGWVAADEIYCFHNYPDEKPLSISRVSNRQNPEVWELL